nr:hypothetical protein NCPCFENI_01281 [Cupriavidus sp.]
MVGKTLRGDPGHQLVFGLRLTEPVGLGGMLGLKTVGLAGSVTRLGTVLQQLGLTAGDLLEKGTVVGPSHFSQAQCLGALLLNLTEGRGVKFFQLRGL